MKDIEKLLLPYTLKKSADKLLQEKYPALKGVLRRNGRFVASNAHIGAIVLNAEYPEGEEGKQFAKGEEIEGKYPNIDFMIKPKSNCDTVGYDRSLKELHEALKTVTNNLSEGYYLRICTCSTYHYFNPDLVASLLQLFVGMGETEFWLGYNLATRGLHVGSESLHGLVVEIGLQSGYEPSLLAIDIDYINEFAELV